MGGGGLAPPNPMENWGDHRCKSVWAYNPYVVEPCVWGGSVCICVSQSVCVWGESGCVSRSLSICVSVSALTSLYKGVS